MQKLIKVNHFTELLEEPDTTPDGVIIDNEKNAAILNAHIDLFFINQL